MDRASGKENLNKAIIVTAVRALAVMLIAVVVLFSLFLLVAPLSAGNFFYGMGMNGYSARMTYTAAERTQKNYDKWYNADREKKDADDRQAECFEKWYNALVRGIAADDYRVIYNSAVMMQKFENYAKLAEEKNITVNGIKNYAESYVVYHEVRAKVLIDKKVVLDMNPGNPWRTAVRWTAKNNSTADRVKDPIRGIKGIIDALIKDKSIEIDQTEFLKQMNFLWGTSSSPTGAGYGADDSVFKDIMTTYLRTSTTDIFDNARQDLANQVYKLVKARDWPDEGKTWETRAQ